MLSSLASTTRYQDAYTYVWEGFAKAQGADIINGDAVWDFQKRETELKRILEEKNLLGTIKYTTFPMQYHDEQNETTKSYFRVIMSLELLGKELYAESEILEKEDMCKCQVIDAIAKQVFDYIYPRTIYVPVDIVHHPTTIQSPLFFPEIKSR